MTLSRRYVKLCDLRDFEEPALLETIGSILPERDPRTHVERKVWEFGMLALFLEDVGAMHEGTRALAVGAGNERVLFWLANRLGRVVATDLYGEGGFAEGSADATMLTDPGAFAPYPYREDRLDVRWMDARSLDFPDRSFDVVFSLSSIEHFGSPADVAAAAREIGRVLRPGGHAFLATDAFVRRHPLDAAPVDFAVRLATAGRKRRQATPRRRSELHECFTASELRSWIVEPSGLKLVQRLKLDQASPESFENVCRLHRDGSLEPATGEYYPHVILRSSRSLFTSVALVLEQPGVRQGIVSRVESYPRRGARASAGTPFELLLAEGTRARTVGLLGSRTLDPGLGLLIPHCDSVHTVAMRFALDVAFVRWPPPSEDRLEVLAVRANVRPGRIAGFKRREAGLRRREVGALELASGGAARLGIRVGEPIALDPPP